MTDYAPLSNVKKVLETYRINKRNISVSVDVIMVVIVFQCHTL